MVARALSPAHTPGMDSAPQLHALMPSSAGAGDGWRYSPDLGTFVADLYAESDGGGLWAIHAAMPDVVPPPRVVTAWKAQWPAFGLLMRQAEKLRAERMMEQAVVIADTDPDPAPKVALRIQVRQTMAERLDRQRFGRTPSDSPGLSLPGAGQGQLVAEDVSDAQLLALALAGQGAGVPGG